MKAAASVSSSLLLILLAACGGDGEDGRLDEAERAAARAAAAVADSAERALAPVPLLAAEDRRALRRHLNAAHVASARQLGVGAVRDSAQVAALASAGKLVRLEDSTAFWVLRDLDYSLPYVTPDARAMLIDIGRRFHERLDSLGVPRYRFEITSVLRTASLQARLRSANPNASRGTSSHEYGTTVDLAYNAFAAPASPAPAMAALRQTLPRDPRLQELAAERAREALGAVADARSDELKAILGETLRAMQEEGRLQALIERAQPVYHLTVSAEYPRAATARTGA